MLSRDKGETEIGYKVERDRRRVGEGGKSERETYREERT